MMEDHKVFEIPERFIDISFASICSLPNKQ